MLDCDLLNQLRLRRLMFPKREDLIQKNLLPLKENNFKKEIAHSKYEQNCQGRSPLLRDFHNKIPISERLGISAKKRVPILGTNTKMIMPRRNRRSNPHRNRKQLSLNQVVNNMRYKQNNLDNICSYKIQVFNDQAELNSNTFQRFQLKLDPMIQAEIRHIQNANPRQIFHGLYPIQPVASDIYLNYRFTNLT